MKTFTAYQNILSSEIIDQVNSIGRDKALSEIPKYRAYLDLMCFGSKKWNKDMFEHFVPVAQIEFNSDDYDIELYLEEVFEAMNLHNRKITKLNDQCRSLSVGDLVRDDQTNEFFIVNNFGFKKVEIV